MNKLPIEDFLESYKKLLEGHSSDTEKIFYLRVETVAGWITSCFRAEQLEVCRAAVNRLVGDPFPSLGIFSVSTGVGALHDLIERQALLLGKLYRLCLDEKMVRAGIRLNVERNLFMFKDMLEAVHGSWSPLFGWDPEPDVNSITSNL